MDPDIEGRDHTLETFKPQARFDAMKAGLDGIVIYTTNNPNKDENEKLDGVQYEERHRAYSAHGPVGNLSNITVKIRHNTPVEDAWKENKEGQRGDRLVRAVYDYITKDREVPKDMFDIKFTREDLSTFHVQGGIVYKVAHQATNGHSLLMWVPTALQDTYVTRRPLSCRTCHPNAEKMKRSMERLYYWSKMQKTCNEVFLRCNTCQKVKTSPSKARDDEQFVPISKPMAVVAIDIVGPLGNSKSATSDNNRFICTMIDWFTRLVVFFAIKDIAANTIGDCIAKFTKLLPPAGAAVR